MKIESNSFIANAFMPAKFSCEGREVNPELMISDIPKEAKFLALIMDDPDAPNETFIHWIVWNIKTEGSKKTIPENSVPGTQGKNSAGKTGYIGPCPPTGTHRYYFKVFALKEKLLLRNGTARKELEEALQGKTIAKAQLMGKYTRR